jgi:hypothetical protein
MKSIGLMPSSTGDVGGKETGQRLAHYTVENGPYKAAYAALQNRGFKLNWQSTPYAPEDSKKPNSKTKYTCPECGLNAWAKPDAPLKCDDCNTRMGAQHRCDQRKHAEEIRFGNISGNGG